MNFHLSCRVAWISLLLPALSSAQWRVFDKQRDAIAQDALREARGIQSGSVFEKQARNLRALSEKDIAVILESSHVRMRGNVNSFRTWDDLELAVDSARASTQRIAPPDIAKAQLDLDTQRGNLKAEIDNLKAVPMEDPLKNVMNLIGEVSPALEAGQKLLNDKDAAGVDTAVAVLKDLQTLYTAYRAQLSAVDNVISQLNDLKIQVKKALLARLKVEEDILLGRVALYERRERELDPVRRLIKSFGQPQGVATDESISITLAALASDRARLQRAVRALYVATAIAARAEIPDDLYRIRTAQLEHMKSIQTSAANARVYEAVLGGGVQRLALFYQGGVKPETLAQIVQSLAATGIFVKLLTQ